ncbi:hypothetical protein GGF46_003805 [Coemansia sp. RSA 552]|nr:hypothetical protein GGF46_003805 [Coemansia sp. RSA 552]
MAHAPGRYLETDPLLAVPRRYARSDASTTTTNSQATCTSAKSARRGLAVFGVPSTIDNAGSTARDFYAAERNYLSWVRLSLAIMSTGAVVLGDLSRLRDPLWDDSRFSRICLWLSGHLGRHNETIGLLLFLMAAFAALASVAVFYHTHAQLAVARRPLRWTNTLLASTTFAIAASALMVSLSTMLR